MKNQGSRLTLAALLPSLLLEAACDRGCESELEIRHDTISVSLQELSAASHDNGEITTDGCTTLCSEYADMFGVSTLEHVDACTLEEATASANTGERDVTCTYTVTPQSKCDGRMHASVLPRTDHESSGHALGAWLADIAWHEAASVGAFRRLARELEAHHAPSNLVGRALQAARDEIRHARTFRRLAADLGACTVPVQFGPVSTRSLREIGVENAVEGCVRETWGALLALYQAEHAHEPYRSVFREVAADETAHAQWSWDLDDWLRFAMSARDYSEVVSARRLALHEVAIGTRTPRSTPRCLGLPAAEVAACLVDGLRRASGSAGPTRRVGAPSTADPVAIA